MSHTLWLFQVTGGDAAGVHLPGNPALNHNGNMTLGHLMLTEEQKDQVVRLFEGYGCKVTVRQAEQQTEEQEAERRSILGIGKENFVWPSTRCPECFWFDPRQDNPCSYKSWPQESVTQALFSHNKAGQDLHDCPIHGDIEDHAVDE
jgi:hypothetical protein